MNPQEIVPAHAFKQIVTHSHKAPRGIHQKAILQITFDYCKGQECIKKFRLVCKCWKHAVETKRFDKKMLRVGSRSFPILKFEKNGKFKAFVPKYLKMFKRLKLTIDSQIVIKWDPVNKLILQNMKNLHKIQFNLEDDIPQNFDAFALQLFQKSQSTLTTLVFRGHKILPFPIISLPNVTKIEIWITVDHDEQIEQFKNFVQRILENCEYLETFLIFGIHDSIQMIEYIEVIEQNYPENCLHSVDNFCISRELPTKTSLCPFLSSLPTFKYPSSKKCLLFLVNDFNHPYGERWGDYKSILAPFSNLQNICVLQIVEDTVIALEEALQNISPVNQDIWKERIEYLKSSGIEIVNNDQFTDACIKLTKQYKFPQISFWSH